MRGSISRTTDVLGNVHWRFRWSVGRAGNRRRHQRLLASSPEVIPQPQTPRLEAIKTTAARTAESVDRWLRGISSGW